MRKILIIIMMQFGVASISAQDFKFGEVSKEELLEKFNPVDPSAKATVLYRREHTSYDLSSNSFNQVREVQERIKIYSKEGFDWATKRIVYLSNSNIRGLKGVTYNLIDGEINKTKIGKEGVFIEKMNKYVRNKKFTFPKVKEGCVIEYKYNIDLLYAGLDDVNFQYGIPVKRFDLQIVIPEFFKFRTFLNPRSNYIPNYTYKNNVVIANLTNIPALKNEEFIDNLNNYRAKLLFEYKYFYPAYGVTKVFSSDWNSVIKRINNNKYFGEELAKYNYFKKDVDDILNSSMSQNHKIKLLFEFVKSKMTWDESYSIYAYDGIKNSYKKGTGGVADINLMLVAMLRYAKINANPVLLSTKENGIPLFPTRRGFNYVVCGVEIKDKVLLLDATNEFTMTNILPLNVLNWQGRIIRENGTSAWVDLQPEKNSKNTTLVYAVLSNDLVFEGKVNNQKTDYYAYEYRNESVGLKSLDLIKKTYKNKGDIEISNLITKNDKELNKAILNSFDFTYEEGIEEIGSEVYISPMLFLSENKNIFNNETREYPIDFNFPKTKTNIVNISIPEGYKIKSLPESVKMVMPDDLGEYSFKVKSNGNIVQVSEEFSINSPIISSVYYVDLKEVYKKLIEKNSEKIVLEKI